MGFFDRVTAECRERYNDANIVLIPRVKEKNSWIDSDWGRNVTCFDPFQSLADLQNDVKALVIKPLTCLFLCKNQLLNSFYELMLAGVHLITLSPTLVLEHLGESATSCAETIAYAYLTVCELILQTLSLLMRSIISIGFGLGEAVCGAGQSVRKAGAAISGFFDGGSKGTTDAIPLTQPSLNSLESVTPAYNGN